MKYSRHFILHKPYGYLSMFIYNQKRKKKLLGELHHFPEGTMAIGRLDESSEGLLFLTTDGKMSEQIRSNGFEKEYYAQVDGIITEEAIQKLRSGLVIGVEGVKYQTKPCEAKILNEDPGFAPRSRKIRDARHGPTSWISLVLNEGKFRQVRKMTAACGFPTLRLIRVRIGDICLGKLAPGEVKEVNSLISSDYKVL